jgi:hypothetical protein
MDPLDRLNEPSPLLGIIVLLVICFFIWDACRKDPDG